MLRAVPTTPDRSGPRAKGTRLSPTKTLEAVTHKRLELFAGGAHPELSQEIADHLGVELGEPNLRQFANGEMHCRYGESIRGSDVFIIQTHAGP